MASGQTIAGVNIALALQSAAFLRGIDQATRATAKGTQEIKRNLESMNTSFMQVGRQVTQFANAFQSLFAVQQVMAAARALADYSDSWQQINNQLRAAESISGNASNGMGQVFEIAQRTRIPIADLGDLYSKMVRVSGELGVSQYQVAQATEITAQAFKAGGASTLEQVNGIRQLIQALGSGILQGDELRSIRENAPLLAQAIAEEFHTTIAGLKQLGAEGKLTSDRVFQAIINGQARIAPAFKATNMTIAESFTLLNNAMTKYIGEAGQSSGASNAFAQSVKLLADNLGFAGAVIENGPFLIWIGRFTKFAQYAKSAIDEFADALPKSSEHVKNIAYEAGQASQEIFRMAGAFKEATVRQEEFMRAGSTEGEFGMFAMANADRKARTMGPEQGLDYEKIAANAIAAEAATDKLVSKQRDWATQVEVSEAGKLQIDAYKNLKDYIESTEQPLATYQRTMGEIAVLERDHALTSQQAFAARVQSMATFSNTFLGAASAMSGALASLFKENKAIAIANAVINTAEAISAALKNPPGPPFSFVYAAAAAVAGAAQIAAIVSAQPGSAKNPSVKGGGGKKIKAVETAGSASTSSSSGKGNTLKQSVTVIVEGDSFGPEHFKKMVDGLNGVIADGAVLRMGNR
jgi:tape measure domain-containing protein